MANQKFTLAYCNENQHQAEEIQYRLSKAGISFELLTCEAPEVNSDFNYQLSGSDNHILLLVSDNFLKSPSCLYNTHSTLQNLIRNGRLTPIIIDGVHRDENGDLQTEPTQFDRVSHVIHYMNHWQDQYLEMRKKKREVEPEEEEHFNEKLKIIRGISSEIGELLRFLRNAEHFTFEQISANHFELFFQKFGLNHLHAAFVEADVKAFSEVEAGNGENLQDTSTPPSDEVEELFEEEQEEVEVPIADIPGMDLLSEKIEEENSEEPYMEEPENQEPQTEIPQPSSEEDQGEVGTDELENIEEETETEEEQEEQLEDLYKDAIDEDLSSENVIDSIENLETDLSEEFTEDQEEEDEEYEDEDDEEEDEEDDDHKTYSPQSLSPELERIAQSATFLAHANEVDQGLNLMKTLVKTNPDNPVVKYKYASYLIDFAKDHDSAKSVLEEILEEDDRFYEAYLRLAELAEGEEDFLLAKNYYEKVRSLHPNLDDIDYKLGLLIQTHFPDQQEATLKYFKQAVKKDKTNVDALYRYALLLSEIPDKKRKAIKFFRKTLKQNPEHPFANYDLALLYHQEQEWEEAAKYYEKACEINPELKTDQNDQAFGLVPDEPEVEEHQEIESSTTASMPVATRPEQVICITGATSGIGRATAELFAKHGYKVILTGRRNERLEELKADFTEKYHAEVEILPFDVRNMEEAKTALENLPQAFQNIDILINNAGLARGLAPIHEGDIEHWDTMIDTNIKGLLYMTRLVSPGMVERQNGHIINVCSIAGKEVYPQGNVYCATKHAVDALTKSMRMDLHQHNVRVSQVSPGHVEETEFALVRFNGDEEKANIYEDFKPVTSADVAEAILFLVTRPAHVNIQDIVMTGTQQASATMIDKSGRG